MRIPNNAHSIYGAHSRAPVTKMPTIHRYRVASFLMMVYIRAQRYSGRRRRDLCWRINATDNMTTCLYEWRRP